MGKIKDAWEEAKLLTDDMYSARKTIKAFLLTIAFEAIVGPFLFWWFEDRKRNYWFGLVSHPNCKK